MNREQGHLGQAVQTTSSARRIKILSMGEPGVGKSCLIKRYCEGRFIQDYVSTIGIDYGVKTIMLDDKEVKVNFWDVAGDPVYFEIRNEFYKAILVCDVSNRRSFDMLDRWIEELLQFYTNEVLIFLVANKIDAETRVVSPKEIEQYAAKLGCRYFETSAATGDGVGDMFDQLFEKVLIQLDKQQETFEMDKCDERCVPAEDPLDGFTFCRICGTQLESSNIVNELQFSASGEIQGVLLSKSAGQGPTTYSYASGSHINISGSADWSIKQKLIIMKGHCERMTSALRIVELKSRCWAMYEMARMEKKLKWFGLRGEYILAACILQVCRDHKTPITIREVARCVDNGKGDPLKLGAIFKRVRRVCGIPEIEKPKSEDFIVKACRGLSDNDPEDRQICDNARKITNFFISAQPNVSGNTAAIAAAAGIVALSGMIGKKAAEETFGRVAKRIGCTANLVRTIQKDICVALRKFGQDIPWLSQNDVDGSSLFVNMESIIETLPAGPQTHDVSLRQLTVECDDDDFEEVIDEAFDDVEDDDVL